MFKTVTFSKTGLLLFFFFQSVENTYVVVIFVFKTLFSGEISDMLFNYSNSFPKVFILHSMVNWIPDNN